MTQFFTAVAIIGTIGLIGGTLLSVVSTLCDKNEENTRLTEIREALPGANCGACGFAGCDSYAEAVDKGEAKPNLCAPGGAVAAKKLSDILGIEVTSTPLIAKVLCNGCNENAETKYNYKGLNSCAAALSLGGGPLLCDYGCLGLGDCLNACPFNAIVVENGLAKVISERCTGCGACSKACPKKIIKLVPKKSTATVLCSNHNKGSIAGKVCKTACIGCSACVKVCPNSAITMDNFLAVIDSEKCTACGKCAEKCIKKAIDFVKI